MDARGLCAEAFAPIEPNTSWVRPVLEERARCYAITGHPLKDKAQADLEEFLAEEPASLWGADGPGPAATNGPPVSDTSVP